MNLKTLEFSFIKLIELAMMTYQSDKNTDKLKIKFLPGSMVTYEHFRTFYNKFEN